MHLQADMPLKWNPGIFLSIIGTSHIIEPHADTRTFTKNTVVIPTICLHRLGKSLRVQNLGNNIPAA